MLELYDPYHPNDGHGPGVPLPDTTYRLVCTLNGVRTTRPGLDVVAKAIKESAGPGVWQTDIYCDIISLTQIHPSGSPLHHWRVLCFKEINHDQTQAEHGTLPPLPDSDRVEARP